VEILAWDNSLRAHRTAKGVIHGTDRLTGEIDADAYLRRVPSDAKCKGVYFHDALTLLRKANLSDSGPLAELAQRRYIPFRDYSLREHMEITLAVSKALFPELPGREAMRRLGLKAFPTFMQTLMGRIIFKTLGPDLDQVLRAGPRSFEVSLTRGRAVATRVADGHWRYEFSDMFGFLDTYYVGVMEGPIRAFGYTSNIEISATTLSDAVMNIRWI
jgi:uncharacterized protein (TIGR02265 family)